MKGRFIVVEEGFEGVVDGVVGNGDVGQDVDDPGPRREIVVVVRAALGVFEGIALEQGNEVGDGEHGVVEVKATAESTDGGGNGRVGLWVVVVGAGGCGG